MRAQTQPACGTEDRLDVRLDLSVPLRGVAWGDPISVAADATVRQVASLLARLHVGAVLVRPDDAGTTEAGIVSERDVVAAVAAGLDLDRTTAADIMTFDLVTVDVVAVLAEVVRAMAHNNVRHVAITDGEEVVGVLSSRDVLRRLANGPGDGQALAFVDV